MEIVRILIPLEDISTIICMGTGSWSEKLNSTLTGSKWKAVFLTFPVELSLALSVWYHLLHMTTWLLFWFFWKLTVEWWGKNNPITVLVHAAAAYAPAAFSARHRYRLCLTHPLCRFCWLVPRQQKPVSAFPVCI
jgi:hypothetical protein